MSTPQPKNNIVMADFRSPQKENGYTAIANELLDAMIVYGFSKREWSVLMAVIRKTYGYNKKEDAISGWQIAEMTGIDRSDVSKTIADLESKNVLIKSSDNSRFSHGQEIKSISINKNYASWITVGETPTVGKTPPLVKHPPTVGKTPTETVGKTPTPPLVKHPTQKTTTKDNKDNSKSKYVQSDAFALFWTAYPKKKNKQAALKAFAKLNPSDDLLKAMIATIEVSASSADWKRDGGQYIPMPSSWLNGRRWEDENVQVSAEYTPEQIAVFDAYNAVMPDAGWPSAVTDPYIADRAAALIRFLQFSKKPNWLSVYFDLLARTEPPFADCGFDYAISAKTFAKVKEGAVKERAGA